MSILAVLVVVSGMPMMAFGSAATDPYVPYIVTAMFISILVGVFAFFGAVATWRRGDVSAIWDVSPRPARVASATSVQVEGRPSLRLALDVTFGIGDVRRVVAVVPDYDQRRNLVRIGSPVSVRVHPNDPNHVEVDWVETVKHARAQAAAVPKAIAVTVLRCASCGAQLELGGRASVVCQYCQTENHVVRA